MSLKFHWLCAVLIASIGCAEATGPGTDEPGADAAIPIGNPDAAVTTEREINCIDGLDEDGDGARDCADTDCARVLQCQREADCANGTDDNANGKIDCADPDCDRVGSCELGTERSCGDANDNDGDRLTDCGDPDCASRPTCVPETNCSNGMDDEGDGVADCRDVDCDGLAGCEFGTERSCTDGTDNDRDGAVDCADPDCSVLAACAIVCPAGTSAVSYAAAGLPLAIPDFSTAQASVSVSGAGVVGRVAARIELPHQFTGDLGIDLIAPGGARVTLTSGNGGFGAGFIATVFDDSASAAVVGSEPPFTGAFRPQQPLATLAGRSIAGTWILRVTDQAPFWTGSLDQFSLFLCVCSGPDCERGAACGDGVDNDADGSTDCADSSCADAPRCMPETACGDGVDNDGDGPADCADTDCAGTALCQPETDCGNGIDDDGDGRVDCADPGCATRCEAGAEVSCNDGIDNDADGTADCLDSDCELVCALPACSAGERAFALTATDLPRAIEDTSTVSSSVTLERPGTISRVAVRISATHTYDGDLDIALRSPAGVSVDLSSDNGDGGDDYDATIFVDTASTLITAGTPPFRGSYRPEQALATLNGGALAGAWRLDIADDAGGDTGAFERFQLAICAGR
jgi:subtilisin-like proprotein convertase family protein